jgi:regulator of protease activity HflC (stomatin/prohibitin superfamily)
MDLQAEAERRKRATILDSEGQQQSDINKGNGFKQATVLRAEGEAEAIKVGMFVPGVVTGLLISLQARALATAEGIKQLSSAIREKGGNDAVSLRVAEQYVDAFAKIAKSSTTMLLPGNASDAGSMVAQAMSVFKKLGTGGASQTEGLRKASIEPKKAEFIPAKF